MIELKAHKTMQAALALQKKSVLIKPLSTVSTSIFTEAGGLDTQLSITSHLCNCCFL